jgi:hypothetical protein
MNPIRIFACLLVSVFLHAGDSKITDPVTNFLITNNYKFGQPLPKNLPLRQMGQNNAQLKKDYMLEYDKMVFKSKVTYIMINTLNNKIHNITFIFKKDVNLIYNLNDEFKSYKKIKSDNSISEWISEKYRMNFSELGNPTLNIKSHNKIEIPQVVNAEDAMQRFQRAIVGVISFDASGKVIAQGSGVFNGIGVLTNLHVIKGGSKIKIKDGPALYDVSTITMHPSLDLAFLETLLIDPMAFMNRDPLISADFRIGQKVYTIGDPIGLERSISEGIISGLRTNDNQTFIQTTAPISPGSSGGGLFNESGYLIGITTASIDKGQNLNFAIPIGEIDTTQFVAYVPAQNRQIQGNPDAEAWKEIVQKIILEYDMGNYNNVIDQSQNAIRQYPKWHVPWYYLGEANRRLRNFGQAVVAFNKCIEYTNSDSEKIQPLAQLIISYIGSNNNYEARRSFDKMKTIDNAKAMDWLSRSSQWLQSQLQ